jgi:hypothetical protein
VGKRRDRERDRGDRDRDYNRDDRDRRRERRDDGGERKRGPQTEDICYNCGKTGHW